MRRKVVLDELEHMGIPVDFDAIIGRGGLAKPVSGGVYEVNEQMLEDSLNAGHKHACDLGCVIAHAIAKDIPGCRSFIADPGVVDELSPLARISGSPQMPRVCIWHALNQRAIARRFANQIGKKYEDLNLIICHLGGGISIAAHERVRLLMLITPLMAKDHSRQKEQVRFLLLNSSNYALAANILNNNC